MNIKAAGNGVIAIEIPVGDDIYNFQWHAGKKTE